jgi:hypothetical protein
MLINELCYTDDRQLSTLPSENKLQNLKITYIYSTFTRFVLAYPPHSDCSSFQPFKSYWTYNTMLSYFNICTVHLLLFCAMTNKCTIDKLSHYSYMFRHYCVILREFVVGILPSYTSMSNAAIGNII